MNDSTMPATSGGVALADGQGRRKSDRARDFDVLPDSALISLRDALRVCGICAMTYYRYVATGRFPKPLRLASGGLRFRVCDIRRWIAAPGMSTHPKDGASENSQGANSA
jgi:predicted DNA-binding transcriptional regulator AlpA